MSIEMLYTVCVCCVELQSPHFDGEVRVFILTNVFLVA